MLIPENLHDEETEIIRRIRANERVESYETVRLHKDGTRIHISLTVSPIRDGGGRVIGASTIARDITTTRENEARIRLLLREINHRVKNQYAVILSVIRETGLRSTSMAEFQDKVRERITALAASHDLLVKSDWSGSTLAEIVTEQLSVFGREDVVVVSGPLLSVSPNTVQNLGMAFHELGTNSAKYGVLSGRGGSIEVSWRLQPGDEPTLEVEWLERFEPPLAEAPTGGRGFGTVVLDRVTPLSLSGRSTLERTAQAIRWHLSAPAGAVIEGGNV
jgi:two-component sensor histidine kinase